MSYTTTDLLTSVRNRANLPNTTNNNNVNSNVSLLGLATEELLIQLVPKILSVREEFYVRKIDYDIQAGQAEYKIPSRATGQVLRDIQFIDGSIVRSAVPINSEYIHSTQPGQPDGYYLEHNKVVLHPTPSASKGKLRLRYFLRPGKLIETSSCAQITNIDTSTNEVTVAAIPATWTDGTKVDFIQSTAPFSQLDIDQAITSVAGTVITFSSLPSELGVGDWIAPAGCSPIPQLPEEFLPVLAQMTVVKALEANGDREAAKEAWKALQTILENAISMVAPRNYGERKKVINTSWNRYWY